MNDISEQQPTTLGEKLTQAKTIESQRVEVGWLQNLLFSVLNLAFMSAIAVLPLWWLLSKPEMSREVMLSFLGMLIALWLLMHSVRWVPKFVTKILRGRLHPLLAYDHQGFMRDLALDQKTVIFDGSNIYHFGHANGVDAQPLGMVAEQLRTEGYRVVCFLMRIFTIR